MTASLDALFDAVRSREKRVIVYRRDDDDADGLFATRNVHVTERDLPAGCPEPFVVVEEDAEFKGALAVRTLESLLEPPVVRPEGADVPAGYRVLFDVLDDTVFTSLSRRELLAVAREIEERAFRVGRGTLRVTFQSPAVFRPQVETYRRLGESADLDVHVHGIDGATAPRLPGVTYHARIDDSIADFWALAFLDETTGRGSTLVAKEDGPSYRGFWTDDDGTVRAVLGALADA